MAPICFTSSPRITFKARFFFFLTKNKQTKPTKPRKHACLKQNQTKQLLQVIIYSSFLNFSEMCIMFYWPLILLWTENTSWAAFSANYRGVFTHVQKQKPFLQPALCSNLKWVLSLSKIITNLLYRFSIGGSYHLFTFICSVKTISWLNSQLTVFQQCSMKTHLV